MKLRQECIGNICTAIAPNGTTMTVTIADDKRMFKLYKDLKLDVFESKKAKSEPTSESTK